MVTLLDGLRARYSDEQIAKMIGLAVRSSSAVEGVRLPAKDWQRMEAATLVRLRKDDHGNRIS